MLGLERMASPPHEKATATARRSGSVISCAAQPDAGEKFTDAMVRHEPSPQLHDISAVPISLKNFALLRPKQAVSVPVQVVACVPPSAISYAPTYTDGMPSRPFVFCDQSTRWPA